MACLIAAGPSNVERVPECFYDSTPALGAHRPVLTTWHDLNAAALHQTPHRLFVCFVGLGGRPFRSNETIAEPGGRKLGETLVWAGTLESHRG